MRNRAISSRSAVAPVPVSDATVPSVSLAAPAPVDTRSPSPLPRVVSSAYWIVDPGAAKQSQDWIYAGPSLRRSSRPRRSSWPGLPAALGAVACVLASLALAPPLDLSLGGALDTALHTTLGATLSALRRQPPLAALLAAGALYAVIALAHAAWRVAHGGDRIARRRRATSPGRSAAADGAITFTEAAEAPPHVSTSRSERPIAAAPEDEAVDAALTDEEAATRQAWEGRIPVRPPPGWSDRPLVVAIADGVGSGLRPADMARVATRTAWRRTFHHLHALADGAPTSHPEPWLVRPASWPGPGTVRDELIVRAMSRAFADANAAVIARGRHYRGLNPDETRSAATTLSLLALDGPCGFLVHVGDCSVHHVHGATGAVEPRQVEHNRAAAYAQGDPARHAEARQKGLHNVLTRWLGMSAEWLVLDPQILRTPFELMPGDALVLCSDGLDKHVSAARIGRTAVALDAPHAARRLVDLANHRGGSDHIAVAVLSRPGVPARIRRSARLALWREDTRSAFQRHTADAIGLLLAGIAAAAVAWAALSFATFTVIDDSPAAAATSTPLPGATPAASGLDLQQAAATAQSTLPPGIPPRG